MNKKLIKTGTVLVITLIVVGCNFRPEVLRTQFLFSIDQENSKGTFVCPKGKLFRFVIGSRDEISEELSGTIDISRDNEVFYSVKIDTEKVEKSNWLEHEHNLKGLIIDWTNTLDEKITPKNNYTVQINFDNVPPEGLSLWLSYVELWTYK